MSDMLRVQSFATGKRSALVTSHKGVSSNFRGPEAEIDPCQLGRHTRVLEDLLAKMVLP